MIRRRLLKELLRPWRPHSQKKEWKDIIYIEFDYGLERVVLEDIHKRTYTIENITEVFFEVERVIKEDSYLSLVDKLFIEPSTVVWDEKYPQTLTVKE